MGSLIEIFFKTWNVNIVAINISDSIFTGHDMQKIIEFVFCCRVPCLGLNPYCHWGGSWSPHTFKRTVTEKNPTWGYFV